MLVELQSPGRSPGKPAVGDGCLSDANLLAPGPGPRSPPNPQIASEADELLVLHWRATDSPPHPLGWPHPRASAIPCSTVCYCCHGYYQLSRFLLIEQHPSVRPSDRPSVPLSLGGGDIKLCSTNVSSYTDETVRQSVQCKGIFCCNLCKRRVPQSNIVIF